MYTGLTRQHKVHTLPCYTFVY